MSAIVELSKDVCVMCEALGEKQATESVLLKVKAKKFQGSVCHKHQIQLLNGSPAPKKKGKGDVNGDEKKTAE
jgi:hypothetical protein